MHAWLRLLCVLRRSDGKTLRQLANKHNSQAYRTRQGVLVGKCCRNVIVHQTKNCMRKCPFHVRRFPPELNCSFLLHESLLFMHHRTQSLAPLNFEFSSLLFSFSASAVTDLRKGNNFLMFMIGLKLCVNSITQMTHSSKGFSFSQ